MKRKKSFCRVTPFIVASLVLICTFSCARDDKYIGTYKVTDKSPPEWREMWVDLKADGKGIRRVHGEEVEFEWKVKGSEIRVHTQAGGILVGKMKNGTLEVSLPGSKVIYLEKVK